MALKFKAWFEDRPTLDVHVSATWFLLSFIYVQGVSMNDPSIEFTMSGLVPVFKMPVFSLAMCLVCLAISVVVLIEPLLPSKLWRWTTEKRHSNLWLYLYSFNVFTAYVLGFLGGIAELTEKLFHFPWLINLVSILGFCIFLVLMIKVILPPFSSRNTSGGLRQDD